MSAFFIGAIQNPPPQNRDLQLAQQQKQEKRRAKPDMIDEDDYRQRQRVTGNLRQGKDGN